MKYVLRLTLSRAQIGKMRGAMKARADDDGSAALAAARKEFERAIDECVGSHGNPP